MTKAASAPPSVASLPERLREAMNEARKKRDQARTLLLSTVLADIKNRELELHHPASDEETVEVVRRAIRRRHEAAEQYAGVGRRDHAERELAEVKMLEAFLPPQADPEEIRRAARAAIAGGAKDVGKVMGLVMPQCKGRADGKLVNQIVREVPGGVLEGSALAQLTVALAAARVVAGDLARLARDAPRTATLRVEPPPKALETRLRQSLDPEGNVLDGASRDLARARQAVREAR